MSRAVPCGLALALGLCWTLAACTRVGNGGAEPGARHAWTQPGHLRIGAPDEPDNLDPLFAHTDATDQIDALIFAPVFRYDERGEMLPELATVVPTYANGGISRDSKTITLHWRRGVRWSDGAPLGPSDLRFTWRAVTNKRNNTKALNGWTTSPQSTCPTTRRRSCGSNGRTRASWDPSAAAEAARIRRCPNICSGNCPTSTKPPSTPIPSRVGRGCCARGTTVRRSSSRRTRGTGAAARACGR